MNEWDHMISDPSVFADHGVNSIVDRVMVEVHDVSEPTQIIYYTAALVQPDGDVVGLDGVSPVSFALAHSSYYIFVYHRDHLGAMTAQPVVLGNSIATVDFRNTSLALNGTNPTKIFDVRRLLWPGIAQLTSIPRKVSYTGLNNDRDRIFARIGGISPTATYVTPFNGPAIEDVNMDSVVKYTGPNNDRDMILQTVGATIPTNVRFEQLPY